MINKISDGFGAEDTMLSFARELWTKVPHKETPTEHPYRARERALIEQQQKYKNYRLISDDEDEQELLQAQRKVSKKERKRKHLRQKAESSSSSDEEFSGEVEEKRSHSSSESSKAENERMKDLQERDAFAERLKQKDKDKQRNIVERSDRKIALNVYFPSTQVCLQQIQVEWLAMSDFVFIAMVNQSRF